MMIVRMYQTMKILLFLFWVRSKNMVAAHSSIIVVSPSVFCTWKGKCYHVGRAPHSGVHGSGKIFATLVHFHRWKKMLQKNLSLIGLSVCLIILNSSIVGLCAYLISLSQKKPISTGLFWEKLVKKCKVVPDYVHFFHKLQIWNLVTLFLSNIPDLNSLKKLFGDNFSSFRLSTTIFPDFQSVTALLQPSILIHQLSNLGRIRIFCHSRIR